MGKVRPAVVVSREDDASPRATAICVPLTTQNRDCAYEVSLGKLKFLDKPSWANVQGIAATGHEKLLRRLGRTTRSNWLKFRADRVAFACWNAGRNGQDGTSRAGAG